MIFYSATIFLLILQVGDIYAEELDLIILLADYGHQGQLGHIYIYNVNKFTLSPIPVSVAKPRALDYDHTDRLIYFTDLQSKQIRRVDINGGNDVEVARLNLTSSPEGLTLDPNARQVFYTDNGNNLIGRVEMDNFNHTVIVNTGLDKPRGIVADTVNKKLYWVDFGSNPRIETSDYDGGERSTLIYSGVTNPLEITIDENGRLYWTEGRGVIESVSVDGIDRRSVYTTSDGTPSHISIFNGFMYFTDFNDRHLLAMPLERGYSGARITFGLLERPRGIHVFSPNLGVIVSCPFGKYGTDCSTCGACVGNTVCEKTSGVCLSGCQVGYTTQKCTEKCPPGTFGDDCQSTCNCIANGVCDVGTGSCPNGCQTGWKGENCSIECSPGTFGQACESKCSETCKSNKGCDSKSGKCADGCKSGWRGDFCTQGEPESDGPPIGLIAGVVCGVVVVIIVVGVVVVCVIRKKRTKAQESDYFSGLSPGSKHGKDNYETLDLGGSNPGSDVIASVY